jgi:lipopolysaccharide/colanic/teichoic acid biosynthesis glycosyltransferase
MNPQSSSSQFPWRDVEVAANQRGSRGLNTLYTRPQLEAVLLRERARADRNRCEFSLILFRVRAEDRKLTMKLAKLLLRRSRGIDELGWFDDTCVAALLPYTAGEGAKAFAESTLKMAQEQLIPAICRIYTYPSAWYFEDENKSNPPSSNGNGNGNGNGHSNGNGDGLNRRGGDLKSPSANGNGHGHAKSSNGNGHHSGNGNGNGNGNGKANGNGNGHHSIAMTDEGGTAVAIAEPPVRTATAVAEPEPAANDLMQYVVQGMCDGLQPPDAGTDSVETLLVRPLPWWKRAIDICGAGFGLFMASPLMIFSALAIKLTSRGPVIFKQRRAGLGGQPFWIYKFRTMTVDAEQRKASLRAISEQDGPAFKLTHDPRVTRVGKFLRETSLDELPQLWNVIKGDMSLVGPRPLPMDESAECQQWQRRRLDVTPGLTCIWQVKGRSRVTFVEWMRMDVDYIRRRNLWHDVKILAQTIPAVLLRRGAK